MKLPEWFDNLIFNELKAQYCPRNSDMTNIDDDKEKTLNYLGTYFPRSYAESYCIFSEYFKSNNPDFADKEELSIFDFGSNTTATYKFNSFVTMMDCVVKERKTRISFWEILNHLSLNARIGAEISKYPI